ncbi:MAG: HEPN domain-containing protein [Clostridiales bacterium]|jgi:HEPN domain-containing protein|nr:HEPN domain-containing protein [Clostridiales bacterium]
MLDKAAYWLDLADEDVLTARALLYGKRYLHAGLFCHLIAEKALKAMIASVTSEIPPKIHDLAKLAYQGGIFDDLSQQQRNLLKELNPLHIEARYPEHKDRIVRALTPEIISRLFKETEDFLCWIKQRLEK